MLWVDSALVQRQLDRTVRRSELVPHPVGTGCSSLTYRGNGAEVDVLVEHVRCCAGGLLEHSTFGVDEDTAPLAHRSGTVDAHREDLVHNRIGASQDQFLTAVLGGGLDDVDDHVGAHPG